MPEQEKELFSWQALARNFSPKPKEFYVTTIAIASVVGLILFLAEGAMPVILLSSLIFLYYVLHSVAPSEIDYKITSWGIRIGGRLTPWSNLLRFWISKKGGSTTLTLATTMLPGRLELIINEVDSEKIKEVLKKYLAEEESPQTLVDKTLNWVGEKLPKS